MARPVGRPSKYRPEYCDQLIDYFSNGQDGTNFKYFPCVAGFAASIGSFKQRIYSWAEENPKFHDSLQTGLALAEQQLNNGALSRQYDSGYARFAASNYLGMSEKQEIKQQLSGTVNSVVTIEFVDPPKPKQ